jgi:hypothetical protein
MVIQGTGSSLVPERTGIVSESVGVRPGERKMLENIDRKAEKQKRQQQQAQQALEQHAHAASVLCDYWSWEQLHGSPAGAGEATYQRNKNGCTAGD